VWAEGLGGEEVENESEEGWEDGTGEEGMSVGAWEGVVYSSSALLREKI
jgi:hypothetical protein